jgi:hypothetical protein
VFHTPDADSSVSQVCCKECSRTYTHPRQAVTICGMSLGQWRPVRSELKTSRPVRRESDAPGARKRGEQQAAPLDGCGPDDGKQVDPTLPIFTGWVDKNAPVDGLCDNMAPQFDRRFELLCPDKHQANDH